MSNYKKAVAALTAIISMASLDVGTISASAASITYKPGDVNGDGYIVASDIVMVEDFINGKRTLTSAQLTRADANHDYIIDEKDVLLIQKYIEGKETSYKTTSEKLSIPENSTRTYDKYTYSPGGGSNKTTYSLSRLTTTSKSVSSLSLTSYRPEGRIDAENADIVQIETDNGTFSGIVVGDHTIATTAEAVYDSDEEDLRTNISINVYKNSNATPVKSNISPQYIHIPKEYITNKTSSLNYALIEVDESIDDYGIWSFGITTDEFKASSPVIEVSGFKNNVREISYANIKSANTIHTDSYSKNNILECNTNDMGYAFSSGTRLGGVAKTLDSTALGITSEFAGYNDDGTTISDSTTSIIKITPTLAQFYKNNPNIN